MLNDEIRQIIQTAYSTFLDAKDLKPRYGQRLMIAEIAKVLANVEMDDEGNRNSEQMVCVVEAGTGTGKTVAYAVAAIPIAQYMGKKLVISTATVALQEQIVYKDLPDIAKNTGLPFSYTLAKGRGRYLCLSKLDQLLQGGDGGFQTTLALYEQNAHLLLERDTLELYHHMLDSLGQGTWNGDRDEWPEIIADDAWRGVTTEHSQCTGRRCSNYQQCYFYKAREDVHKVDVIVCNHDLVLADLALGGGAVLPPPASTIYVFDEGHHLPAKALQHFSNFSRIRSGQQWLENLEKSMSEMLQAFSGDVSISQFIQPIPELNHRIHSDLDTVYESLQSGCDFIVDERAAATSRARFHHGVVPAEVQAVASGLADNFSQIASGLEQVAELINETLEDDVGTFDRSVAELWYPLVGSFLGRASSQAALWYDYALVDDDQAPPKVRWVNRHDFNEQSDYELCCSPMLADRVLTEHLWQHAFSVVVTSATLTALGGFDRFIMRSGVPTDNRFAVVPSPFNYAQNGRFQVPQMQSLPGDREAHTEEITDLLPRLLADVQGGLVLFSSWRQMLDVKDNIEPKFGQFVKAQGDLAKLELIKQHRADIDAGNRSILFGLASFAEGLDLPGDYCSHVVIAKLPFAVPDSPIEAAISEWIEVRGGNAFMEISVPDASLKLIQASGRLLRTESDQGVISLLDRRVVTKRYGRALLQALPPYQMDLNVKA